MLPKPCSERWELIMIISNNDIYIYIIIILILIMICTDNDNDKIHT